MSKAVEQQVPFLAPILQDRVLTPEEVFQLTRKRRPSAQAKVLRANNIEPIIAADGSVQVTAFAVALACTPPLAMSPDSDDERAQSSDRRALGA